MRELGRLFRTKCANKHTKWAEYISEIEKTLNNTVHYSTGFTPQELHYGTRNKDGITEIIQYPADKIINHEEMIKEARRNLKRNFETRKKQQKNGSKIIINIGNLVLLRIRHLSNANDRATHKFFHLYEGPYRVKCIIGRNAFVLSNPKSGETICTYNRSNLRRYFAAA